MVEGVTADAGVVKAIPLLRRAVVRASRAFG
jgi:hypothetical protein